MSPTSISYYVEQMSGILSDLIGADPDDFSFDWIDDSIQILNGFASSWQGIDDAEPILGLIDRAITHLYTARARVTDDPRTYEYYENIVKVTRICETIASMR